MTDDDDRRPMTADRRPSSVDRKRRSSVSRLRSIEKPRSMVSRLRSIEKRPAKYTGRRGMQKPACLVPTLACLLRGGCFAKVSTPRSLRGFAYQAVANDQIVVGIQDFIRARKADLVVCQRQSFAERLIGRGTE